MSVSTRPKRMASLLRASIQRRLTSGAERLDVRDAFLSRNELEAVKKVMGGADFSQSLTEHEGQRIVNAERTSETAAFPESNIARTIMRRVADRYFEGDSGISIELQIVKYGPGASFHLHHDAGMINDDDTVVLDQGDSPRAFTVFIYVNDTKAGEGRTVFPRLDASVQPVAGRAVLFPNLDPETVRSRVYIADALMVHSAEPISTGVKIGINVWVGAK